MSDGILHQPTESLRRMVALIPGHPTDTLLAVALPARDLRPDQGVVFVHCRFKLVFVVVRSNDHVAPLTPVRIESIVKQHPSPH